MNYVCCLNCLEGLVSPSVVDVFQLQPSSKCLRAINELLRISNHIIRYQPLNFIENTSEKQISS